LDDRIDRYRRGSHGAIAVRRLPQCDVQQIHQLEDLNLQIAVTVTGATGE
jgi:hypothetical protein